MGAPPIVKDADVRSALPTEFVQPKVGPAKGRALAVAHARAVACVKEMSQGGSEGGGFSQGMPEGNTNGIILVWDLDQTLINGPNIENINENALRIMHEAFESPKFTANLMLTNNGNEKFITMAQIALRDKYNQMFDESQRFSLFSIT